MSSLCITPLDFKVNNIPTFVKIISTLRWLPFLESTLTDKAQMTDITVQRQTPYALECHNCNLGQSDVL